MNRLIFTLLLLFPFICGNAANYYWVGGSGNWSDAPNHWASNASGTNFHSQPPGPNDNVNFTDNSFTGPQTVKLDINGACRNMDWSSVNQIVTFQFYAGKSMQVYGSLTLYADLQFSGEDTWYFRAGASTSTNFIEPDSASMSKLYFDDANGTWELTSNLNAKNIELISGAFYTNSQNITTDYFTTISPNSRVLNIGDSRIVCYKKWEAATNSSGFTIQGLADSQIFTAHFKSSILSYNKVLLFTSSDGNTKLEGDSQFGELYIESNTPTEIYGDNDFISKFVLINPNSTVLFAENSIQTFYGEIKAQVPCGNMIRIGPIERGTQYTWLKNIGPVVNLSYLQVEGCRASGNIQFKTILSVDNGNNSGWFFNTPLSPKTYYWIDGGGGWSDPAHWSLSSGGPTANCIPTIADDVIFDQNSFPTNNPLRTVNVDHRNIGVRTMDFSAVTNSPTFDLTYNVQSPSQDKTVSLTGSLILSPNMTLLGGNTLWQFEGKTGNHEINTRNHSLHNMYFIEPATYSLMNDLTLTGDLLQLEGSLNTNNRKITANSFVSNGDKPRALALFDSEIRSNFVEISDAGNNELLFSAGTSLIVTPELITDSRTFHEVRIRNTAGSGNIVADQLEFDILRINTTDETNITGSHTYNDLLQINNPGIAVIFEEGSQQSILNDIDITTNCNDLTPIKSSNPIITPGNTSNFVTFVATSANFETFDHLDIQAIQVVGGSLFVAYNSNYIPTGQEQAFGWFLSQGACVPLPVELTLFEANKNRTAVDLKWTTASELNTDYFAIERSQNGIDYEEISRLTAQGNSSTATNYDYTDRNPLNGKNYYRLKIVDFDGSFEFSETRLITFEYAADEIVELFPNPTKGAISLEFHLVETTDISVEILDAQGRSVLNQEHETLAAGNQILEFNLEGLANGLYFFNLWIGQFQVKKKVLKVQ